MQTFSEFLNESITSEGYVIKKRVSEDRVRSYTFIDTLSKKMIKAIIYAGLADDTFGTDLTLGIIFNSGRRAEFTYNLKRSRILNLLGDKFVNKLKEDYKSLYESKAITKIYNKLFKGIKGTEIDAVDFYKVIFDDDQLQRYKDITKDWIETDYESNNKAKDPLIKQFRIFRM